MNDLQVERDRLSQAKLLAWLSRDMAATEMVTVYLSDRSAHHDRGIYCALVPSGRIAESLKDPCWDLMHGHGVPGATEYTGENGERCVEYLRFGDWHVEPLVIDREFHGIRPDYVELSEEFRLFHSLFHDRKTDQFLKIDDDGSETLVATIEPNRVQVRLKELRQFLAVKEMHLVIQFDCREHSNHTLEELGLRPEGADCHETTRCWGLNYGSFHGMGGEHKSFSRLLGKRFIPPLPKEKSGFWGVAEPESKDYEHFIIAVDANGDDVTHSSDPDTLSNYFGANPGEPHYLTAVHFRKSVLDKYYQQAGKYTVGDSVLWCGRLWSLYIDNHHDDRVCAWLGDLGRDLPHSEQLHWRSYNIPPVGGVSDVYFRRQILAQFTDSTQPEHVFQYRYESLAAASDKHLGWRLLLPLAAEDQHYLHGIRVPATDEQKDFDDLILGLAKVLVDSLNEAKLGELIAPEVAKGLRGSIAKLEAALTACGVADHAEHIKFMRNLQNLRSTGSAHRKGSNYQTVAAQFGVDSQNLRSVFRGILQQTIALLEYLTQVVEAGRLAHPGAGAPGPSTGSAT